MKVRLKTSFRFSNLLEAHGNEQKRTPYTPPSPEEEEEKKIVFLPSPFVRLPKKNLYL